ncbi:LysM peptidoglycan-binding domain-containing protein [Hyalangium rubrum]|uniref:LysM peptidoglycan-binding domain-containing protein n=1 Tax=Hyalangium rubrum TaxID=3103134 RepID=A0ABU5H8H8_9BACT|nr:LysM peptidoglycan-binding domain-containing protein [Hyalangium sp. s54d21]MDY7229776.1 LysM peptidoglycan-binding domain-containing protein [Hyalangium sp. s54d21]
MRIATNEIPKSFQKVNSPISTAAATAPLASRSSLPADGFEASQSIGTRSTARVDAFQATGTVYTVRAGDTLSGIAQRFGTTVDALSRANSITNPDRIYVGQQLSIPSGTPTTPTPPPSTPSTYTVRAGDTLSGIAQRFGTTVDALMRTNGLSNPDRIYVGQTLTLPGGTSAPTPPTTPTTPGTPSTGPLSNAPNHTFTLQELWPTIERYGTQYGFDPKILAGMVFQESSFKNHIVHLDGTGHGLLGYDDNGLLGEFEAWVRTTQPGQQNFYAGRGANAVSIPPEWQLEFAAKKLADFSRAYGGPHAAARAWHRGPGGMNDWRGQQYEQLIRSHVQTLFPGGQTPTVPSTPTSPPAGAGLPTTLQEANRFFLTQWGPTASNSGGNPYGFNDCGPTSGVMALAALGLMTPATAQTASSSIDRVRDAVLGYDSTYSTRMGTSQLAQGLRALGARTTTLSGPVVSAVDQALARGNPVILGGYGAWSAWGSSQLEVGNYLNGRDPGGHFITVLGKTPEGQYLVGDPLVRGGTLTVSAQQLATFYGGNGFGILEVSRPAAA